MRLIKQKLYGGLSIISLFLIAGALMQSGRWAIGCTVVVATLILGALADI